MREGSPKSPKSPKTTKKPSSSASSSASSSSSSSSSSSASSSGSLTPSSTIDYNDDAFLLSLIDAVQTNQCVYNRLDPLHKNTDHKHEIWAKIAKKIGYDAQPVELERKWKHMRDKYVRLRKQDKLNTPMKKTNKWYTYYMRMSFLDQHVEHRNRKTKDANLLDESFGSENGMEYARTEDDDHAGEKFDWGEAYEVKSPTDMIDECHPDPLVIEEGEREMLIKQYCTPLKGTEALSSYTPYWMDKSKMVAMKAPEKERSPRKRPHPTKIAEDDNVDNDKKVIHENDEVSSDGDESPEYYQILDFVKKVAKSLLSMDQQNLAKAQVGILNVLATVDCTPSKAKKSK